MDDDGQQEILRDGTRVTFRSVSPGDEDLFREGLERLSPLSIYNRFFTVKASFTEAELQYLTDVDGIRHCGLVALTEIDGETRLIGVVRYVQYTADPPTADVGLIVADEFQGIGLGGRLFTKILQQARENRISVMTGEMLASNSAMFGLVDGSGESVEWSLEGTVARFRIQLA